MAKRKAELSLISSNLPSYFHVREGKDFLLNGRIQFDDDRAPSWVTASGELAVLNEDDQGVDIQINAQPSGSATTVRYGLLPLAGGEGGFLPFGLTLNSNTGKIAGDVQQVFLPNQDAVTFLEQDRPTWNTASQTWFYDEQEAVSIGLSTTSNTGTSIKYTIEDGNLPWGLTLSPSGSITGSTQEVMFGAADEYTQYAPRWNTPHGTIIAVDEFENVSYQLDADLHAEHSAETLSYRVIDGSLPWGLTLSPSGLISGQTQEVTDIGLIPKEIFPKPKWVTPFGIIKKIREKGTVNIQLNATPENGNTLTYRVIEGNLPWGITLTDNGLLSGSFNEIVYPELPDIVDENAPTMNASSSMGSYNKSQSVSKSLSISLYSGRTLARAYVEKSSRMPLGLTLNSSNGVISGTISDDADAGTYTFTVTVIDSADMRSSKVFNMTVL